MALPQGNVCSVAAVVLFLIVSVTVATGGGSSRSDGAASGSLAGSHSPKAPSANDSCPPARTHAGMPRLGAADTRHADALQLADMFLQASDASEGGILKNPGRRVKCYCAEDLAWDDLSDLTSLSDLEEQSKHWRWKRRSRKQQMASLIPGVERCATKNVEIAQKADNSVVFNHFSLSDASTDKKGDPNKVPRPPGDWVVFDGSRPMRALSADGYDLAYHFPRAFRGETLFIGVAAG
ncbi:hypothetical protein C8Q76DRAFT_697356 [Earliella scabrosa]|nr:hypothetical protein C8Q76DRAFT_697356 [Earliella scabrosa]